MVRRSERLTEILERVSGNGSIGVADLAGEMDVSPTTIRRDLELLQDQNLLARTHGGAVAHGVLYELPLRYKAARHQVQKQRIAVTAASRVKDGTAVGLTGGTTTTEIARAIVDRAGLTVVTNALNIASELAVRPNLKLVVTGGVARPESYELVGALAEKTLVGLNLDIAFIGVDGISLASGLTTHHEVEAQTNRALIERARSTVAVTDGSKVGKTAFAQICPAEAIDELITDATADPEALEALTEAGLRVHIA